MTTATRVKKVDSDTHFLPPIDVEQIRPFMPKNYPAEAIDMLLRDTATFANPNARRGGFRATAAGQRVGGGGAPTESGAAARPARAPGGAIGHGIAADRAGLLPETGFDMQVLIPDGIFANSFGSPVRPHWEPGVALGLCMAFNNAAAAAAKELPETFIPTARVPLALDVQESCREAERAVKELGTRIIVLTGNWMGKNFDEIELFPFWRTVQDLGAIIYVHGNPFGCQVNDHVPSTYTIGWERMRRLHISNYLGFAFEGMMCCASLTLGGLLEEFPDLKVCNFESGGSWLPWVYYTLDRVYGVERQCARCSTEPSELLRKAFFVAMEPDENNIVHSVAAIGSENFIVGSDYPHPPSTFPNTAAGIESMAGLSEKDKENILGGNLTRLFGLN
jgi:aminocarboxymuconate-semialdehyde decarboxylase